MADLGSYYGDYNTYDLRMSIFQLGEHDTWVSSNGPTDVGLVIQMNKVLDDVH